MNRSAVGTSLASFTVLLALCTGASAADCAAPKLVNSLPMTDVPGSDTMTVPAAIDGQPQRLLVGIADTTQLWNEDAAKLDLALWEGRRTMDGGGRFSEYVARVEHLTMGAMETGYFVTQISPDPDFANAGSDGVLGTDMMQRYDIDLDFAHHQLNYFSPEQCQGAGIYWSPSKLTSVKMATYARVVYVPVNLDGKTIVAALDTTADRTILNPELAKKLFGLSADSAATATVRDSGAMLRAELHRFSMLTFGGLAFRNPEIAIPFDALSQSTREFHANHVLQDRYPLSQIQPDMIIGMDVLGKTHLYISFQDQRVYVSPDGDGQPLPPQPIKTSWFNVWHFGYDMVWRDRHPFVGF
jgi:hypothetical protein